MTKIIYICISWKYIKYFSGIIRIYLWKSNGISEESIENVNKSDILFSQTFVNYHPLPDLNFNGHCLINNISIRKKVINLYISHILNPWLRNLNTDFTLNNCFFGPVELAKNADRDKYKCSGYDIGVDFRSDFTLTDGSLDEYVIIFGVDVSLSIHIDNKNKDILING